MLKAKLRLLLLVTLVNPRLFPQMFKSLLGALSCAYLSVIRPSLHQVCFLNTAAIIRVG